MRVFTSMRLVAASSTLLLTTSLSVRAKSFEAIQLRNPARFGGIEVAPGVYELSWKSHRLEAAVTLKIEDMVVATVAGKWVERGVSYDRNALVYENAGSGLPNLIEIRFTGKSQVLVLADRGVRGPAAELMAACAAKPSGYAAGASAPGGPCIGFLGKPRVAMQANPLVYLPGYAGYYPITQDHGGQPQGKVLIQR